MDLALLTDDQLKNRHYQFMREADATDDEAVVKDLLEAISQCEDEMERRGLKRFPSEESLDKAVN
jgi:hypothetical protein